MADPIVIGSVVKLADRLIDRLFPDKEEADKARLEMYKLQQAGELEAIASQEKLAVGQLEVNKTEAQHRSVFVAGWRPSVGWICTGGLGYEFILQPFLAWASVYNDIPAPPSIDTAALMTLLTGMLGMGGFRTYEKLKGKTA